MLRNGGQIYANPPSNRTPPRNHADRVRHFSSPSAPLRPSLAPPEKTKNKKVQQGPRSLSDKARELLGPQTPLFSIPDTARRAKKPINKKVHYEPNPVFGHRPRRTPRDNAAPRSPLALLLYSSTAGVSPHQNAWNAREGGVSPPLPRNCERQKSARRSLHPVGRPRNPETGKSRCREVRRPVPR